MSVPVTVAGVTYQVPTTQEELWGLETTDYLVALGEELASVVVPGDIGPETLVTIQNNQAVAANIPTFILNPVNIRSGVAEYYVHRVTVGPNTEVAEAGTLYFLYNDSLNAWTVAQVGNNVAATGVVFTITTAGQVQYTSTNLSGTHTGRMKFRLRVLQKT
jgi:hypothetical protein